MEDKEAFEKIVEQIASLNCKPSYVLITKVDALLIGYSNFRDLGNGWVEIDLTKDHDINRDGSYELPAIK